MLASVLPGLREIRAPLAAGYLWLFGIWLMLANSFLAVPRDESIGGNIRVLLEYLEPAPSLAALTFVAYLLGLFLPSGTFVLRAASRILILVADKFGSDRPKFIFNPAARSEMTASNRLHDLILRKVRIAQHDDSTMRETIKKYKDAFKSRKAVKNKGSDEEYLADLIHDRIYHEIDMLSEGLFSRNRDAYNRLDRLMAEAEFRGAILFPLTFIAAVLAHRLFTEDQQTYATLTLVVYFLSAFILYRLWNSALKKLKELVATAILVQDITPPEFAFLDDIRKHDPE